jgi:hypothetical protein
MSTTTSFDDASLDFRPTVAREGGRARLLETLRLVAEALRDGADAAHRYQRLTRRGMHPADAAQAVFEEHFQAR